MATPIDHETREKLLAAIAEGISHNGVKFSSTAVLNLRGHLPRITQQRLIEMIEQWIRSGQEVSQVEEQRPTWADKHDDYYKIVMQIGGTRTFIELRLIEDSRVNPPQLLVANIHPSIS